MLDSRWASIDAFAENNRDNILRDITDVYKRQCLCGANGTGFRQ